MSSLADCSPAVSTFEAVKTASSLRNEASALLDKLSNDEATPGATVAKAFERYKRRRDLYNRAADAHWGVLGDDPEERLAA